MKGYKQFVEEMKTNEVTITEAEVAEIVSDAMADERIMEVIKEIPATFMLLSMFGADIVYRMFHKKDDEEKQESEDKK